MRQAVCAAMCVCMVVVLGIAPGAAAQSCPPTPTGLFVEWSACNNGPRVNWTLPPGQLLFPRVFRSLTPNVADATLAVAANLNTTSAVDEGAPANTDLYYWVEFQGINPPCTFGAKAGPVLGRRIALGGTTFVVPSATTTVLCNSVRVEWPRIRENAGQALQLRRNSSTFETLDIPLPAGTTSYTDTSGVPGRGYSYLVFYLNTCRGTEGTDPSPQVLFPRTDGQITPSGADVNSGQTATLSASFVGYSPAPTSVQWFKGEARVPVTLGQRVITQGTSLQFNPALESDTGIYFARGVTACGSLADVQVALIVRKACPADFNASGAVTVQDVFDFLTAFFAGCP